MVELVKRNFDSRVFFLPDKQRLFLESAMLKSSLNWKSFANTFNIHPRTLNDWRREKYSLPLAAFKKILSITKIDKPRNIETRSPFWFSKESAIKGGKATYKKYGSVGGNPEKRQKKWQEWWIKSGQYNSKGYFVTKQILNPRLGKNLAEFVGIMLGDGGITTRQVTVTLNSRTDLDYSDYVRGLIERLFGVQTAFYTRESESVVNIVVSRKKLVEFCVSLGLKRGNKIRQGVDVPKWIYENKEFQKSCIRGLLDTDGCIFQECHTVGKKKYCYPRLSLVSYSIQLRKSVYSMLMKLDFSPRIRNNRSVQLESKEDILKYFHTIGSHNPKHNQRAQIFIGGVG